MNSTLFRLARVGFLLGVVLVLLRMYLGQVQTQLPPQLNDALVNWQVLSPLPPVTQPQPLTEDRVLEWLQSERSQKGVPDLIVDTRLQQAAASLSAYLPENGWHPDQIPEASLSALLHASEYPYAHVAFLGVSSDVRLGDALLEKLAQADSGNTLASASMQAVGYAVSRAQGPAGEVQSIIVLVGQEVSEAKNPQSAQALLTRVRKPQEPFVLISNTDILLALNQYRQNHGVPQLVESDGLCRYAEKRLQDQLDLGTLDKHQGFIEDYSEPENLPDELKAYAGKYVAENIAFQSCRNMSTGQEFTAQTATELIEWCFDGSVSGHRENQLNPRFNDVCVRGKDGFFVVLFAE